MSQLARLLDFDSTAASTLPLVQQHSPHTSHSSQLAAIVVPRHSSLTYLTDYWTSAHQRGDDGPLLSTLTLTSSSERKLIEELDELDEQRKQTERTEQTGPTERSQQPPVSVWMSAVGSRPEWVDTLLSAIASIDERLARIESSVAAMERSQGVSQTACV